MVKVSSRTMDVAADWKVSDYYDDAEQDTWTLFWKLETPFRRLFDQLDTTSTVELACGHGRHCGRLLSTKTGQTRRDIGRGQKKICRIASNQDLRQQWIRFSSCRGRIRVCDILLRCDGTL